MTTYFGSELSRREFLKYSSATAIGTSLLSPRQLFADSGGLVQRARASASAAKISAQSLRGGITVLIGAGGNIAVLAGPDGKLLVDGGFAGARAQITEALQKISADPIKHLINTHWHFDHTDGNEWMHAAGAAIVAHQNTRKHLSSPTYVKAWDFTFPPAPSAALPTITIGDQKTLHFNKTPIALKHFAPAHTDGDLSVYFADADVLHAGDTFWNGRYPFIDYSTGGNIDGMIQATEENLAGITDKTIVVPGHGKVGDKSQLTFYRDLLASTREKVASLKRQGRSLEEIVAARPTAATDAEWGKSMTPALFIGLVFEGI